MSLKKFLFRVGKVLVLAPNVLRDFASTVKEQFLLSIKDLIDWLRMSDQHAIINI
jgi:hypothetical protein